MSNFKPQVTVITQETNRDYHNRNPGGLIKSPYKTIQYPTYKELRKDIHKHLLESLEYEITVIRSRKGNWGEWFEKWVLINGKPQIIKQGWM